MKTESAQRLLDILSNLRGDDLESLSDSELAKAVSLLRHWDQLALLESANRRRSAIGE